MFIAQPAEEVGAGAMAMLMDGLFTRFPKPNFGFALHASGAFAYGTVLYTVGAGSSNYDGLYIKFRGRGGHGAAPQVTIDPVMMAARFVVDVQSVISREKDPTEFGVVSIGTIQGGTAANIIPDEVVLTGTIRSFKPEVKAAFGDKLRPIPPVTPSEDYSQFISAGVPSMFFRIGVYEPERVAAAREGEGPQLPGNHSPLFAPVPKQTIETGITAMTLAVLSAFDQNTRHK